MCKKSRAIRVGKLGDNSEVNSVTYAGETKFPKQSALSSLSTNEKLQ